MSEEQKIDWVLAWIGRMAEKFGGICYEKNGKKWDWGQALCRLCYGENWDNYISENNIEAPTQEDIELAKEWENGKIPKWQNLTPYKPVKLK